MPPCARAFANILQSKRVCTTMTTLPTMDPPNTMELDSSLGSLESASSQKGLSGAELIQHVSKMVKDKQRAELIILELMEEYSFSFPDSKELLRGKLAIVCNWLNYN
jgi:hypothetical protein